MKHIASKRTSITRTFNDLHNLAKATIHYEEQIPKSDCFDFYSRNIPYKGAGGDHVIWIDYERRCNLDARIAREGAMRGWFNSESKKRKKNLQENKNRVGVTIIDAAGHDLLAALIASNFAGAIWPALRGQLDHHGDITPDLFSNLAESFAYLSKVHRFVTAQYLDVGSNGKLRHVNAGHHAPLIRYDYSRKTLTPHLDLKTVSFPFGITRSSSHVDYRQERGSLPENSYVMQDLESLKQGELIVLLTDGIWEHGNNTYRYNELPNLIEKYGNSSASELGNALEESLLRYDTQKDDMCFAIIKRKY